MAKKQGKIYVGTSGWHYKHWVGTYYPQDLKSDQFMEYYLKDFHTVEINNSFYKLPSEATFMQWRNDVPADFLYAVKASRFITHMKKLKEAKTSFDKFFLNVAGLEEKLGPILFQLPPGWKVNAERLREFTNAIPSDYRYTFEFRNDTWYTQEVYDILKEKNMAFCVYELEYHQSPLVITADFVYIRLHGPGNKYQGSYNDQSLAEWAGRCRDWSKEGKDVFIYFDNDQNGYAAFNARSLKELVSKPGD